MTTRIVITRPADAQSLRQAARQQASGKVASRLLALADLLEGSRGADAARRAGMDWQTLRDWVHRFNAEGLAGLADRPRSGRPNRLTAAEQQALRQRVLQGPDLETDGVVRWRCVDLQAFIQRHWGVVYHPRSVGKLLHRLGLTPLSVRPRHPKSSPSEQEALKKTS